MKLYLSSYGLGNQPEKLQALVYTNKSVAVILNAQDSKSPEIRAERLERARQEMRTISLTPEELDLRDYFDKPAELAGRLATYGALWIRGGNVFILRRAMRRSGFDEAVRPLVESKALVYAGFSAGSCAAGPNLHGIELVDDKDETAPGYNLDIVWDCLGFVPYSIAPHFQSDHPESADIDKAVAYFQAHGMAYRTLRDGEAIVVDGEQESIVGWPNP